MSLRDTGDNDDSGPPAASVEYYGFYSEQLPVEGCRPTHITDELCSLLGNRVTPLSPLNASAWPGESGEGMLGVAGTPSADIDEQPHMPGQRFGVILYFSLTAILSFFFFCASTFSLPHHSLLLTLFLLPSLPLSLCLLISILFFPCALSLFVSRSSLASFTCLFFVHIFSRDIFFSFFRTLSF